MGAEAEPIVRLCGWGHEGLLCDRSIDTRSERSSNDGRRGLIFPPNSPSFAQFSASCSLALPLVPTTSACGACSGPSKGCQGFLFGAYYTGIGPGQANQFEQKRCVIRVRCWSVGLNRWIVKDRSTIGRRLSGLSGSAPGGYKCKYCTVGFDLITFGVFTQSIDQPIQLIPAAPCSLPPTPPQSLPAGSCWARPLTSSGSSAAPAASVYQYRSPSTGATWKAG